MASDPREHSKLRGQTLKGLGWAASAQVCRQLLSMLTLVALARLLSPGDFGLMGMVLVFTRFATLPTQLGFGAALVQRGKISQRHLSSVFWANLSIGFFFAAAAYFGAPWIALFFKEPGLVILTRVMGLNFVIHSLLSVPHVLLQRRMRFDKLAKAETASVAGSGVVAVAAALAGWGVWSLVLQVLCNSVLLVLLVWASTKWRPRTLFQWGAIRDLMGYSFNMAGFKLVNYWVRNIDYLLIGRLMGETALGGYRLAYSIMILPLQQLNQVLTRIMFPAFSRLQREKAVVKRSFVRALAAVSLVVSPLLAGLAASAETVLPSLLGPQWTFVVPTLQVLCLVGLIQTLLAPTRWVFQALGRTDWMFRWMLISGPVQIGAIVLGALLGSIFSVACAYAVATVLLTFPSFAIPGRLINLSLGEIGRALAGSLLCASLMAVLVAGLNAVLPTVWPIQLRAALLVASGGAVYAALVHLAKLKAYRDLLGLAREQAEEKGFQKILNWIPQA